MAGSYEKRGNSYRLVYMLDGKKHTKTVRCSDKEVKEELARFVIETKDKICPTSSITFNKYAQKWLDEYAKPKLAQRTIQGYKDYLNNRILPEIGGMQLQNIKAYSIQQFLNSLTSELSTCSIKKIQSVIIYHV